MIFQDAIPPNRILVILNFVDLGRFRPRPQLPSRPRSALIFSNQASEKTHLPAVRSACERAGIHLEVVGSGVGKSCAEPEAVLGKYDIVFAKGRAALEALAVGTAVVLCDAAGAGPLVTTENVAQLRPLNFGIRALREVVSPQVIARAIAGYDPIDAANVSGIIRANAGRDGAIDALLSLYREVIDEHHRNPKHDVVAEQQAVAAYLQELRPRLQAFGVLTAKEVVLRAKEVELEMIKNSRSWRLISRYIAIKDNLVLPAYDRISRLWRPAAAIECDPKHD
jgi:glycosyltransferase involved in cell wall biosynthesis